MAIAGILRAWSPMGSVLGILPPGMYRTVLVLFLVCHRPGHYIRVSGYSAIAFLRRQVAVN
eukprot:scaffold5159_cov112-Cylindrotheca_fusiformis.AAC.17